MKKGIIITLGVILSVLLIVIGISTLKTSKTPNTESNESLNPFTEAALKATSIEEKEKSRKQIKEIGKSKYQSVVMLKDLDYPDIPLGTGFIVSKNKLLTNKHVKVTTESTLIGLRDENDEFIDFKVKNVIHAPNGADLSIVEVAPNDNGQNIGDNIKMLEFATQKEINNVKVNDIVNTVGYPKDKPYSTLWYTEGKLLQLVEDTFAIYDTLTEGGSSGSPLLNKDGKIIGLNNAGNKMEIQGKNVSLSFGFLLDKELYEFIMKNI